MLRPIAPLIEFELQKEYIQTFLCEKKDQPITVCGGVCYLKLELEKASNHNSENKTIEISLEDYPIGFVHVLTFSISAESPPGPNELFNCQYSFLSFTNILQPPQA